MNRISQNVLFLWLRIPLPIQSVVPLFMRAGFCGLVHSPWRCNCPLFDPDARFTTSFSLKEIQEVEFENLCRKFRAIRHVSQKAFGTEGIGFRSVLFSCLSLSYARGRLS